MEPRVRDYRTKHVSQARQPVPVCTLDDRQATLHPEMGGFSNTTKKNELIGVSIITVFTWARLRGSLMCDQLSQRY